MQVGLSIVTFYHQKDKFGFTWTADNVQGWCRSGFKEVI